MSTGTQTETDAEREVARFLASQPSPEAIVAFHSSPEVATRMYELIEAERELETYFHIEHLMRLVKAEAYRRLGAQAQ